MFHAYVLAASLYLIWRLVLPLPVAKMWRVTGTLIVLIIAQYHAIQIAIFGSMFSPEMPRSWIIVCGWAFCSFVLLTVTILVLDLISLGMRVLSKDPGRIMTTRNKTIAAMLVGLLSVYGVQQAIQVPPIRRVSIEVPNLPPEFEGMRIVQLSDLHISGLFHAAWTRELVAKTNALNGDLVVITGDLIDGTPEARQHDVAPLGDLRASLGVITIPGNHEYYFQERRWQKVFEQLGMKVLINEHLTVDRGDVKLAIAGVTDEVAAKYNGAGPNLSKAISGVPVNVPIVLLKHRPESADDSAAAGVAVQLSGHTHGGMIWGLNQIARYANGGFISGMYRVGAMTLYVSNGTALWNGFPIRLGVPPEITELTLHTRHH
ncbi:Ser/Thr protein phosphatase [Pseudomonas sp. JV551A1]|uniref:metallophosphoesterase n=1 Tax=Pseudomonas sp. JV551A1 TaxID=2078787 RepID=UPI00100C94A4|nr:metallophosphoesterase [Pseudomonas sp. JV551A1]SPO55725.1 Ser/Thr protein phosphatase [Pseudomonas sp. JV551A1]